MELDIFQDALFASIAAIGFSSISNAPRRTLWVCGAIAAIGHASRYVLMRSPLHLHIIMAGFIAGLVIGSLAKVASRCFHQPKESFSYCALLPMIPGMYAYGVLQALVNFIGAHSNGGDSKLYMDLLTYNFLMTFFIILCMVIGVMVPSLFDKKIRHKEI